MNIFETMLLDPVTPPLGSIHAKLRTLEARARWRTAKGLHEMQPGQYGIAVRGPRRRVERREYLLASDTLVFNLTSGERFRRAPDVVSCGVRVVTIPADLAAQLPHLNEAPI